MPLTHKHKVWRDCPGTYICSWLFSFTANTQLLSCRISIAHKTGLTIILHSYKIQLTWKYLMCLFFHNHDKNRSVVVCRSRQYYDFQNNGFPVKYWRRSRFSFFSFILRFWNQIFTCRSVRLSILDNCRRFSLFMYTLKKNSRSSSRIWYFEYGHLFFLDFVAPTKRNVSWLHCSDLELEQFHFSDILLWNVSLVLAKHGAWLWSICSNWFVVNTTLTK